MAAVVTATIEPDGLAQVGQRGVDHVEEADRLPLELGPVLVRLDPAEVELGDVGPGRVHEGVDTPEAAGDLVDERRDRRGVDEVDGAGGGVAARGLELPDQLLGGVRRWTGR